MQPILPDSEIARKLRHLTRERESLVQTKTQLENQLQAALKDYYPAVLNAFPSFDTQVSLAFLCAYPSPERASKLTKEELVAFLKEQHYTHPNRVDEIYNALSSPQLKPDKALESAREPFVVALAKLLLSLVDAIKRFNKEIASLTSEHPFHQILESLPPAGIILAARLIGEIGDNLSRYESSDSVRTLGGTCPVTIQSGKHKAILFRKACRKPLRATFYQLAFCSLNCVGWARDEKEWTLLSRKSITPNIRPMGRNYLCDAKEATEV